MNAKKRINLNTIFALTIFAFSSLFVGYTLILFGIDLEGWQQNARQLGWKKILPSFYAYSGMALIALGLLGPPILVIKRLRKK